MTSKTPKTLAEVLHHLADGGVVSYRNRWAEEVYGSADVDTVEFRFTETGFESRLPGQDWFLCATAGQWQLGGCTLVPGADQ